MAIARKCDRCGNLYEEYDHIELNDIEITHITTPGKISGGKSYDLCPECCFDFARWMTNPNTVVELIQDETTEIEHDQEVDTTVYAEGIPIFTQKANGEVEWYNQLNEDPIESYLEDVPADPKEEDISTAIQHFAEIFNTITDEEGTDDE